MKIFLIILSFITSSLIVVENHATYCKGKGYEGYIYDSAYFVFKSVMEQQGRYTPTLQDVEEAEKLLRGKLKKINDDRINQGDGCPIIHEKLKKYCRQYVGFKDKGGQKVIWINFIWDKRLEQKASTGIMEVQDGCSYYWSIEVNIDSGILTNLVVNGRA